MMIMWITGMGWGQEIVVSVGMGGDGDKIMRTV